jgi:hypothetical protein
MNGLALCEAIVQTRVYTGRSQCEAIVQTRVRKIV